MSYVESVGIPGLFGLTGAKTAYKDENILLGEAQAINFTGSGVAATLNAGVLTVEIDGGSDSSALALGETSTTAYRGDRGKTAYDHSQATGNPHSTAIGDIAGLQAAIDDAAVNFATPTINTQTGASYLVGTVAADNNGKTYLRMTNASANTVEITTAQTKPISIRQAGTGTTTLVAGSGVTLNGTLAFTAQHQTKTVVPLGSGIYDVVG